MRHQMNGIPFSMGLRGQISFLSLLATIVLVPFGFQNCSKAKFTTAQNSKSDTGTKFEIGDPIPDDSDNPVGDGDGDCRRKCEKLEIADVVLNVIEIQLNNKNGNVVSTVANISALSLKSMAQGIEFVPTARH